MSHSVWATFSYWFVLESFQMSIELDIELPLLSPFIFTPTHFQTFHPFPTHAFFVYSFDVQSTSFNCEIVTSYNQCLVTHHVTFMFNLFNPPLQKLQKIYKKFKVSKKYSKKPKNPSKNLFPLDWVPTKLMALFQFRLRHFDFGICSHWDARIIWVAY